MQLIHAEIRTMLQLNIITGNCSKHFLALMTDFILQPYLCILLHKITNSQTVNVSFFSRHAWLDGLVYDCNSFMSISESGSLLNNIIYSVTTEHVKPKLYHHLQQWYSMLKRHAFINQVCCSFSLCISERLLITQQIFML